MRLATNICLLLFCSLVFQCVKVSADVLAKPPSVLWVFSWHKDIPWQKEIEAGFEQYYITDTSSPQFYYEYMDYARFNDAKQVALFQNYLSEKYAGIELDIVFFEGEPATRFYLNNLQQFTRSQVILLNPELELTNLPNTTSVIPVNLNYRQAVRSVLDLEPDKPIVLISGQEAASLGRVEEVQKLILEMAPQAKIERLTGMSLPNLKQAVASLNPDSVIIYLLMFDDHSGGRYVPYYVAEELAKAANVPIYSFWTPLLGSGITGGYMISGEKVGEQAAILLMNNWADEKTTVRQSEYHGHYFDGRQLERWGRSLDSLPEGAVVQFQRLSLWEGYYHEIIGGIALLIGLALGFRFYDLKRYSQKIEDSQTELQATNESLVKTQNELQQKNQLLEEMSNRDRLTGLYNRGYIDETLTSEIERAERYGNHLSIILVDIDHFKQVNDNFGHQMGDKVLQAVAGVLSANLRSIDKVGRWGGEEFMIICPNSSVQQATLLAEKLRCEIEQIPINKLSHITASFGVAGFHKNSMEEMVNEADAALYRSKDAGRNCVCA